MSYGYRAYKTKYSNTAIISAATVYVVPITDIEKNNHAPFTRLIIVNNSGSDTLIYLNGSLGGTSTVSNYQYLYPLPANYTLIIEPQDNIKINTSPLIYNNSGSEIPVGKLIVMLQNY